MPLQARSELLQLLQAPAAVRADAIGKLHARPDQRGLAEVLIDLEAGDVARGVEVVSRRWPGPEPE